MKPAHIVITTKWGTYPIHRNWLVDPRTLRNWERARRNG